ncbi:dTDP-glucose 4,6-dehydratase [Alphaproteobacteria bacterium]|nr:dTDP-glucose 4,6-dehydratase [Alphaproteobacteria bacterium]
MKNYLITGGCGFIGSHFIKQQIADNLIVNFDKLTYSANPENLKPVTNHQNYQFIQGDILDSDLIFKILEQYQIDYLINFAAETHVDNSIANPDDFIMTNIVGTYRLLQSANKYYQNLYQSKQKNFRFLHVSTDEVFGSLNLDQLPFDESSNYQPNSPYSASKASSDHLVRAWWKTYKLPTIITNCSNNFGANQHQEKFIPTVIKSCLTNQKIPIYGSGKNIRDWIYVEDHCRGINLALKNGQIGEIYFFGGNYEITNLDLAKKICIILDQLKPKADGTSYQLQINFVKDRAGHDFRYAISNKKSFKHLGFKVFDNFEDNLLKTINSYLKIIK